VQVRDIGFRYQCPALRLRKIHGTSMEYHAILYQVSRQYLLIMSMEMLKRGTKLLQMEPSLLIQDSWTRERLGRAKLWIAPWM
jgi:hypothetical protein